MEIDIFRTRLSLFCLLLLQILLFYYHELLLSFYILIRFIVSLILITVTGGLW